MSVLFDAADKHASKRKNKLLDDGTGNRALFSSHAKSPLIPLTSHADTVQPVSLLENYAHLDLSGYHVDLVWALSCMALLFPILAAWCKRGFSSHSSSFSDVPYDCDYLYASLFLSLPGLSVHLFCLFLLLSNRCRAGFLCYLAGVALFVLTVEMHCFYRMERWCIVLFFFAVLSGTSGQAQLVRTIQGGSRTLVHMWHASAALLAFAGLLAEMWPGNTEKSPVTISAVLLSLGLVLWALSTWLTLLPVRIAYVQLYKS